ncbi:hypothetical protein Tco_1156780 [Tanacetum coccineum]
MTLLNQDYSTRSMETQDKEVILYPCKSNTAVPFRRSMTLKKQLQDAYEKINGKIDPITKPNYKYLNKNDTEDLYLLCFNGKVKDYRETRLLGSFVVFIKSTVIWERVHDYQLGIESYQQKVNLTALTITFPDIKREKLFTITSKPIVGMIYENNKKEKRVMIHNEIHKFCDATLKRVLEKLKKYNKDVNPLVRARPTETPYSTLMDKAYWFQNI